MDAKAAEEILPDITYPTATNEALQRFITSVLPQAPNQKAAVKAYKETIIGNDKRFTDAALAQGKSIEEINDALRKIHAKRGY